MNNPESLKEKNLSTVCDVVEILFEALDETNMRPLESLAKEKNKPNSENVGTFFTFE